MKSSGIDSLGIAIVKSFSIFLLKKKTEKFRLRILFAIIIIIIIIAPTSEPVPYYIVCLQLTTSYFFQNIFSLNI
jgi:hypothetical protein